MIDGVTVAADQAGGLCALSELDGAVVAYVQLLRGLPDRRAGRRGMAAHDQQQLVQRGRQARVVGCLLAPAQEDRAARCGTRADAGSPRRAAGGRTALGGVIDVRLAGGKQLAGPARPAGAARADARGGAPRSAPARGP